MTRLVSRRVLPAVLIVGSMFLAGCTPQEAGTDDVDGGAQSTATPAAPQVPPAAAEFRPDGTAADNLPYFTKVVQDVWATDGRLQGRSYIDALVAAGFADKQAMQLTPDETTIGDPADTIQFSVLVKDSCLMGQVGPSTGEPSTSVAPKLPNGTCMIGNTRPIDW